MNINWNDILTVSIGLAIVALLKLLLDFNTAKFIIKYLSWYPFRSYFRTKPTNIKGEWEETWSISTTENFKDDTQRHSHPVLKQLNKYCYAEFIAKGVTYIVFGKVINQYFIGEWYDKKDPIGYFGTFHLLIIDSATMRGKWIGHSKKISGVREGDWNWKKI